MQLALILVAGLALAVLGAGTAWGATPLAAGKTVSTAKASSPAVESGIYSFAAGGQAVAFGNSSRFAVKLLGDGTYSIRSTATGRYLTYRKGGAILKARPASGRLAATQRWRASVRRATVTFKNKVSKRPLLAPRTSAKRFRLTRCKRPIEAGMYKITSRAAKLRLGVAGGSWSAGANAQLSRPSDGIAQKFNVRYAPGGCYRITMALSGTALEAKVGAGVEAGRGKARANVRMACSSGSAAQLWKPKVTDAGLVFVNKATGGVLSVSGEPRKGANVRVAPRVANRASNHKRVAGQSWSIAPTASNGAAKRFSSLKLLMSAAPAGGNRTVRLDAKGSGYTMSGARRAQLKGALGEAWKRGEDVSFVLVDLDTGITVSCGADRDNHGASTFKAAYVTYLHQYVFERGGAVDPSTYSLMEQTMGASSNDAYQALRARFGTAGFRKWLDTIGLGRLAYEPFPRLTARNLARVWAKIYSYEQSGGRYVGQWRRLANHSYYSAIREQLGGSNTVYSKAGWYPRTMGYAALNDGGIVKRRDGRSYLLALLSNTNCYTEQWIVRNVVTALDAVQREMS